MILIPLVGGAAQAVLLFAGLIVRENYYRTSSPCSYELIKNCFASLLRRRSNLPKSSSPGDVVQDGIGQPSDEDVLAEKARVQRASPDTEACLGAQKWHPGIG